MVLWTFTALRVVIQLPCAASLCPAPHRPFTPEEAALWEESAQYAYRSFRDKAAASRNMSVEDMQVRQGGGGGGGGGCAMVVVVVVLSVAV